MAYFPFAYDESPKYVCFREGLLHLQPQLEPSGIFISKSILEKPPLPVLLSRQKAFILSLKRTP